MSTASEPMLDDSHLFPEDEDRAALRRMQDIMDMDDDVAEWSQDRQGQEAEERDTAAEMGRDRCNRLQAIGGDAFPFLSRETFRSLAFKLSPKRAISNVILEEALNLSTDLGASSVPTVEACKKSMEAAREELCVTMVRHKTKDGRIFYSDTIQQKLRWDFMNPTVRSRMHLLPWRGDQISDIYDGSALAFEQDTRRTPPMIQRRDGVAIFTDETVKLLDGRLVRPLNFFSLALHELPWSEGWCVTLQDATLEVQRESIIFDPELVNVSASEELSSYRVVDILGRELRSINPLRVKADGRLLIQVPIVLFIDETSGTTTKRWNEHVAIYFSNAALPRKDMDSPSNVKMLSASANVRDHDLMAAVVEELMKAERAEVVDRSRRAILTTKWHTPLLALHDKIGFDICSGTPVDLLHTYQLGIVKYVWAQMLSKATETQKVEIAARLSAAPMDAVARTGALRGSWLVSNAGGLVGKDLKSIAQVAATAFYPMMKNGTMELEVWGAWSAVGQLGRLLFVEEIDRKDLHKYKEEVKCAIMVFLGTAAVAFPAQILSKPKFHMLLHMADNIEQYGPAKGFSSERYESFNAVLRKASICSNRSAPSKDILTRVQNQELIRHVAASGCWIKNGRVSTPSPLLKTLLSASRNEEYSIPKVNEEARDSNKFFVSFGGDRIGRGNFVTTRLIESSMWPTTMAVQVDIQATHVRMERESIEEYKPALVHCLAGAQRYVLNHCLFRSASSLASLYPKVANPPTVKEIANIALLVLGGADVDEDSEEDELFSEDDDE
ncbi:unnamed protein product [Tilletia caries]|nr:unnamed protein product [Tilletia caries]